MLEDFKEYSQEKKVQIIAHHAVFSVSIHLMMAGAFLCGRAASRSKGGDII